MKYSLSYNEFVEEIMEKTNVDFERQELLYKIKRTYRIMVMMGGLGGIIMSFLGILTYYWRKEYEDKYGKTVDNDMVDSAFSDINNNHNKAYNKTNMKDMRSAINISTKEQIDINKKMHPLILLFDRYKNNKETAHIYEKFKHSPELSTMVDNIINSPTPNMMQRNSVALFNYLEANLSDVEKDALVELFDIIQNPANKKVTLPWITELDELSTQSEELSKAVSELKNDSEYKLFFSNYINDINNKINKALLIKCIMDQVPKELLPEFKPVLAKLQSGH